MGSGAMIAGTAAAGAERGWIFNIQKFSLHDGAGIRTLVFLKGCPLACRWCSNPESRSYRPELMYARRQCIGFADCDRCVAACKAGAIGRGEDGKATIDRERCDDCGDCVAACPSRALAIAGTLTSVDDVLRRVEEDGAFHSRSGGGLTLSGGEPLAQAGFAAVLLAKARSRGIDTAVETSGLCRWEAVEAVARHCDQMFYDIKCIDADKHRIGTGVDNALILENFRRLRVAFPALPVIVRTPVIAGWNDDAGEIAAIGAFIEAAGGASGFDLLAYHGFGEPKYERLGRAYPCKGLAAPPEETMAALRDVAAQRLRYRGALWTTST